ncbi:glycosyltransferase family 2 protein [Pontimicrobium sp. SW4]|uniref:Glycosyltransferase family 2 protein n=1 Tax=Pontimicrobium sp. SW4 TaxID=3153519 RepID=A0AAU7BV71_9FLAO
MLKTVLFNIYKRIKNHRISKRTRYYYFRFINNYFNKVTLKQNKNYKSIPIIIVSYNQLFYLKKLINFLLKNEYSNIVIVDNNSNYKPLLTYFDELKDKVEIHRLTENFGHRVFWEQKEIFNKYNKGYYVLTDPDIVPLNSCPNDFVLKFKQLLDKNWKLSKVGFSLITDDIPDTNPNKTKILEWENRFWKNKTKSGDYQSSIDTTFALYPPKNIWSFRENFYHAIRTNNPYMAIHGGWYMDIDNLTEEQKFYMSTASSSSSWNINSKGDLANDVCY